MCLALRSLLTLLWSACVLSYFQPNVTYFSFLQEDLDPLPPTLGNESVFLFNATSVDDSPMQFVALPWSFPYNGVNIETVWVSPNGGLYYRNLSPCWSSWFYGGGACNVNNSLYGVIAGYYTDLNPSTYHNASMSFAIGVNYVSFRYRNMPFFYQPDAVVSDRQTTSFSIILWRDGHSTFRFDHVWSQAALEAQFAAAGAQHQLDTYIVGLRNIAQQDCALRPDSCYVHYTEQQRTTGAQYWGTSLPGIYPPTAYMANRSAFTMCPVSTVWALSPSPTNVYPIHFDSNEQYLDEEVSLRLHPLSISCFLPGNSTDAEGGDDGPVASLDEQISIAVFVLQSNEGEFLGGRGANGLPNTVSVSPDSSTSVSGNSSVPSSSLATACRFTTSNEVPITANNNSTEAEVSSGQNIYIQCNVTVRQLLAGANSSSVPLDAATVERYLGVAWRRQGYDNDNYTTLAVPLIPFALQNSSAVDVYQNIKRTLSNCTVNIPSAFYGGDDCNNGSGGGNSSGCGSTVALFGGDSVSVSPACSVFHSNFTFVDLACAADGSTDFPTVSTPPGHVTVIEAGETYAQWNPSVPVDSTLYLGDSCSHQCNFDRYGLDFACCDLYEQIDCSGKCFGGARYETHPATGLLYCCSNIDGCGVCNGTDWKGAHCPLEVIVGTDYPDGNIYTYYDVYASSGGNANADTSNLTITNNSTFAMTDIQLSFQQTNNTLFDPTVSLLFDNYTQILASSSSSAGPTLQLQPHETLRIIVESSIQRLVQHATSGTTTPGLVTKWEVKELLLEYRLKGVYAQKKVAIYPTMLNCSLVGSGRAVVNLCSELPGCIFCMAYADMRVLREESSVVPGDDRVKDGLREEAVDSWKSRSVEYHKLFKKRQGRYETGSETASGVGAGAGAGAGAGGAASRQLYVSITPGIAGTKRWQGNGFCHDGWLSDSCPSVNSHRYPAAGAARSIQSACYSVTLVVAMHCVLLLILQ